MTEEKYHDILDLIGYAEDHIAAMKRRLGLNMDEEDKLSLIACADIAIRRIEQAKQMVEESCICRPQRTASA